MNHSIPCPICHKVLQTVGITDTLICEQKKVFIEELNTKIDTIHAMYYLNKDGSILLKIIEIPPYTFEIQQNIEKGFYQTRIQKIVPARYSSKTLERETLLILPGIVSCPWHDQQAVFEKIKLLMLFS